MKHSHPSICLEQSTLSSWLLLSITVLFPEHFTAAHAEHEPNTVAIEWITLYIYNRLKVFKPKIREISVKLCHYNKGRGLTTF